MEGCVSSRLDSQNENDFKRVYMNVSPLLLRIATKIVNEEEAAEDLVHDSFIKMHEKAMVFPSEDDAKFWLIRVVHNTSINYANRKKRERKTYEKAITEKPVFSNAVGDTNIIREEMRQKVNMALKK